MDINIHRKDLIALGLRQSYLSAIVGGSTIFKNAPKMHGYALNYTYNQSFLLYVGCELYGLGLSTRHVDDLLIQMTEHDYRETKQAIEEEHWVLAIISLKEVSPSNYQKYFIPEGIDPFTGNPIKRLAKKRKAPLGSIVLPEKELVKLKKESISLITVNLYEITKKMNALFRE